MKMIPQHQMNPVSFLRDSISLTMTKAGESNDVESAQSDFLNFSLSHDGNLRSSKVPFAWKLHSMLEDVEKSGIEHVVSWVDSGRAFKVHNLDEFVEKIIPFYFRQSKWKSFQRQLYFYGYTRTQSGAYQHSEFVKGCKTLTLSMKPKKIRHSQVKKQGASRNKSSTTGTQNSDPNTCSNEMSDRMTRIDKIMVNRLHDASVLGSSELCDGDRVFVFGRSCFHYMFDNSRYV
jgi:hypothetical protein